MCFTQIPYVNTNKTVCTDNNKIISFSIKIYCTGVFVIKYTQVFVFVGNCIQFFTVSIKLYFPVASVVCLICLFVEFTYFAIEGFCCGQFHIWAAFSVPTIINLLFYQETWKKKNKIISSQKSLLLQFIYSYTLLEPRWVISFPVFFSTSVSSSADIALVTVIFLVARSTFTSDTLSPNFPSTLLAAPEQPSQVISMENSWTWAAIVLSWRNSQSCNLITG